MEYITIKNDIITGHFIGDPPQGTNFREVHNYVGGAGININFLDENLYPKPMVQLVKEGLIPTPEGQKFDEEKNYFVDMTEAEKVNAGLLTLKPTQKVEGDYIIPKTHEELFADNLITVESYNEYIDQCRKSAYRAESDPLGMQVLRGEVEKEEWLKVIEDIKQRYPKV